MLKEPESSQRLAFGPENDLITLDNGFLRAIKIESSGV